MEKVYQSMKTVGIFNMVIGIVMVVFSAVAGAFIIAGGVRLLNRKNEVIF